MRSRNVIVGIYVLAMCLVATRAYADPPLESGIVLRGETPAAVTWTDPDSGLRVVIGIDIRDFCDGFPFPTWQLMPFTAVEVPTTVDRVVAHLDGRQVYAQLWDFPQFNCGWFLTRGPWAEGLADFKNADNDLAEVRDPNRAHAFGGTAHGTLYDTTTGAPVGMEATFRAMFNGKRFQVMSMIVVH